MGPQPSAWAALDIFNALSPACYPDFDNPIDSLERPGDFRTEAIYQCRIHTGKNLVFVQGANQRYRLAFEIENLVLCRLPTAFSQLHCSDVSICPLEEHTKALRWALDSLNWVIKRVHLNALHPEVTNLYIFFRDFKDLKARRECNLSFKQWFNSESTLGALPGIRPPKRCFDAFPGAVHY